MLTNCPKCKINPRRRPGHLCKSCHNEIRRAKRAVKGGLIERALVKPLEHHTADDFDIDVVEPPPPTPLEAAYQAHEDAKVKRDVRKEHAALVEENTRLKAKLDAVSKIGIEAPLHVYSPEGAGLGEAVACMVASDWHVEEPVEAHKVHGLNEYNLEIAEARAAAFFRNGLKLTDMMAKDCRIERIFLGLIGDFITNYIHDELKQTNLLAPGSAANFAMKLLASGIDFLLRESRYTLDIDAIPGNHGRMSLKPQIQNATETSLETFMYAALAMRYQDNPRVNFRVAQSKMLYRTYFERFKMRLIHGDDVKFGGGVGGITIPIRKKLAAWDKATRADLTVMGHFHQFLDGGDFLVNGSLIGYNEFAQAIGASPEEAKQAFFLIHARNGGEKSLVAPIWLNEAHKEVRTCADGL